MSQWLWLAPAATLPGRLLLGRLLLGRLLLGRLALGRLALGGLLLGRPPPGRPVAAERTGAPPDTGDTDGARARRTAAVLVDLLSNRAEYRQRWQRHAQRSVAGPVHHTAVAQVLAHHQWDAGLAPESDDRLPARLKHLVGRALAGTVLAPPTLQLFIDAFAMTRLDAAHLWAARTGGDPLRTAVVRDEYATRLADPPRRPAYQTVSLHDFHSIGPTGLPRSHRTVHVVRALETFAAYPYRFDTDAASVEVLRGGTAGPLRGYPDGTYGVDICFHEAVERGRTASFEYRTTFGYRTVPPPEFRRAVRSSADSVEVQVEFSEQRLPRRLWWATWDHHEDRETATRERVELGADHAAHRFLDTVVGTTVGFVWEFDRPVRG